MNSAIPDSNAQWFSIHSTDELEKKIDALQDRVQRCETTIQSLQNENLKLVNRILEAEVAAERYKNLMLRKQISFPFSPMLSARLTGNPLNPTM